MADNFASLLEATARRRPRKAALVWDGGALSRGELERHAGGFARSLAERGVKSGDRIALSIPNRWAFAVALWGGLKAGATVVPLNPLLAPEERAQVLAHLGEFPRFFAEQLRQCPRRST